MKMETTHLPTVHETVLPDPDCTLFVDGSRFADEQGRYHTGFAVTTVDQVLQASPLLPSMSAQEAELKALTVAWQMFEGNRVNIYTDSRYALGVAHDFGLIWKTRGFLTATGTPVKHGTAIKELMDALLLPEEVAILKVKAHGKRNSEETCGNHKADQAAKDAACESREVDRRVSSEEIPIFPMQILPTDLKFLKEQQAAVSPEEKESWKQKGATLQDGVYTSNLKICLPKSMYPPVVQWAHGAAHLSKTLMNSLITKYFEAPVENDVVPFWQVLIQALTSHLEIFIKSGGTTVVAGVAAVTRPVTPGSPATPATGVPNGIVVWPQCRGTSGFLRPLQRCGTVRVRPGPSDDVSAGRKPSLSLPHSLRVAPSQALPQGSTCTVGQKAAPSQSDCNLDCFILLQDACSVSSATSLSFTDDSIVWG
ncbi:uncharacterized protein RCH25_017686 [Pelodytes ibericus]